MVSMIDQNIRTLIRNEINKIVNKPSLKLDQQQKADGSWVTAIDHGLTRAVEKLLRSHFPDVAIVSEEGSHELLFPCFILDPVDGTSGLIHNTGECSLSLAYMHSGRIDDELNSAYIAHIFSDFEVHQDMHLPVNSTATSFGLVSRSEWKKGLYEQGQHAGKSVQPLGSIALKLAHLAYGNAAFVVTLRPKSIWDIAAGSILLNRLGISLWHHHDKIEQLDRIKLNGPMLWATHSDLKEL